MRSERAVAVLELPIVSRIGRLPRPIPSVQATRVLPFVVPSFSVGPTVFLLVFFIVRNLFPHFSSHQPEFTFYGPN
jgi:hypothetical protein